MALLTDSQDLRRILLEARTIAVLGAHPNPSRAGHYVADYLYEQGYRIIPVNPAYVGETWWGEPVVASLVGRRADLVDVFRRPDHLLAHLDEILAMDPLPRTVWLQSGIRHAGFARHLVEAGVDVVQSECTLARHRNFGLPPIR